MLKLNMLKTSNFSTFFVILILTAVLGRQVLGEDFSDHIVGSETIQPDALDVGLYSFLTEVADGNKKSAAVSASEKAIKHWLGAIGEDLPDWAKRFEFEADFQEDNKPEWSILTVQPLFESDDLKNTFFVQMSQRRYQFLGDSRDVTNAGLGYRRLFNDNKILAGINSFFDYEWDYNQQRYSVGGELKWSGLELSGNKYFGLSNWHTVRTDQSEKPLDGHDIELGMQLPFIPWARVYGKKYWWETFKGEEDIDGWSASLEMDLTGNLQLEAGYRDDNTMANDREGFVQIRFHLGFGGPVAMSNKIIDSNIWEMRDMRDQRLVKVRRENKIITERVSSGVVIKRGT
jgi:hypothetical protein